MREGTRRPKETVMIRFGGEGVGGVQEVKVSIWWRGREREVAIGLMGTGVGVLLVEVVEYTVWRRVCFRCTNPPGSSSNRDPRVYLVDRLHLCLRFFLDLLVAVCAGRGGSRC
jgi:hypothetical protein